MLGNSHFGVDMNLLTPIEMNVKPPNNPMQIVVMRIGRFICGICCFVLTDQLNR